MASSPTAWKDHLTFFAIDGGGFIAFPTSLPLDGLPASCLAAEAAFEHLSSIGESFRPEQKMSRMSSMKKCALVMVFNS